MALSQSLPTPNTQELFRVVTRLAVGAPLAPLPVPVAPTAPAPFTPDVSTPVKVTTVIDAGWLLDRAAVTDTLVSEVDANARQISALPLCTLVRRTSVQVSPAPVTLFTTVFAPVAGASAEIKASSSSLADVVENVAVATVVALVELSLNTIASVASVFPVTGAEVKLTLATLAPLSVTGWLVGVKVNPVLVGVTV